MQSVIPGTVHAALVVLFTYLVQLAFTAIGFDLSNDIAEGLATLLVGYILSLLGLDVFVSLVNKARGLTPTNNQYKPPFT